MADGVFVLLLPEIAEVTTETKKRKHIPGDELDRKSIINNSRKD